VMGPLANSRMKDERICSSGGMINWQRKREVLKAKPVSVQLCLLRVKISLGLPWERTWTFAVRNYFGLCTAGAAVRTSKYCFILDLFVNLWDVSIF
jgi:hypothetical protein